MNKYVLFLFFSSLLLCRVVPVSAFDLHPFRHSEIADKNSIFFDVGPAPFMFKKFEFNAFPLEIRAEYLPPLPLPFSFGFFFKTPNPNLRSFGPRLAYHLDLNDPFTDLYIVYSFDYGFIRNPILEKYHDVPADIHFFDFRAGIRRFFGQWFGLTVESGFKFESIIFLLSCKLY